MLWRSLIVGSLALIIPGCFKAGPKTEADVYQETIKRYDELSALLQRVTDEKSSNEKLSKVKKICEQLKELKVAKDEFDLSGRNPQRDELKKRYDKQMGSSARRVVNQYQRVRQFVPGSNELATEVQIMLQYMGINPAAPAFKSNA